MDKAKAEKIPENVMRMVDAIIAWLELYVRLGLELEKWVKANGTTTPPAKPQGAARLRQGLEDIVRISTTAIEEKNPELMVKIALKTLREAAKPQGDVGEYRLIDGENWVRVESVCDTIKALEAIEKATQGGNNK